MRKPEQLVEMEHLWVAPGGHRVGYLLIQNFQFITRNNHETTTRASNNRGNQKQPRNNHTRQQEPREPETTTKRPSVSGNHVSIFCDGPLHETCLVVVQFQEEGL
jgi:cytoskeletal protein RodZ